MKIAFFLVLILMSGPALCISSILPEVEDYQLKVNEQKYGPGNLWDLINGAAELFLSYHFVELTLGEYTKDELTYRVELYDQFDNVNAYGMYASERAPDFDFIDLGVEGYIQPGVLNFLLGKYYIKMSVYDEGEEAQENLKTLARAIADNSSQSTDVPVLLHMFPQKGKLSKQDYYFAENYLGHSFLNRVFAADYKINDVDFQLFIIQGENVKDVLADYFEFAKQKVKIKNGDYTIKDPYNGDIHISKRENYLFGIIYCENLGTINEYRSLLDRSLK